MRVAAIDCGTNSVRLLIADVEGEALRDVVRRVEVARLGQGVDATGRLADEALDRVRAVLASYSDDIAASGVDEVRMVATSATRDASNADDFRRMVRSTLDVEPEVVSGDEEARLSFTGAVRGLPAEGPFLVVDVGGGSTELVLGSSSAPDAAISLDIGSVRLTERHFHDDPPTPEQVAAANADISAALRRAAPVVPLTEAKTVVGVAGSVTTTVAIALGLTSYQPSKVQYARASAEQIFDVSANLLLSTHDERAANPVIHPGRLDIVAAGSLIVHRVLEAAGAPELVASEHDILDGIAYSIVER